MSQELLARQQAHKALNRKLEDTPGSGYHDRDTDPTNRARALAPHHNPDFHRPGKLLPRISEHIIAYHGADDVLFVGEDADTVLSTCQAWHERNKGRVSYEMRGDEQKLVFVYIPRLKVQDIEGVKVLSVRRDWWNDVLQCLYWEGIGITGAPQVHDGSTP